MAKKESNIAVYLLLGIILFSLFGVFILPFMIFSSIDRDLDTDHDGLGYLEVVGPIMESKVFLEKLGQLKKNNRVKALVVRIDSPGGAVAPSQEMFRELQKFSTIVPVITSMGNVAASGGYYMAIAAQRIFASPGTITGSIGVITQLTNLKDVSEFLKLKVYTFKSGKYKDVGNPFRIPTEDDKKFFQSMIDDIYDQFVTDVAIARNINLDELKKIADGRVLTGRQAKAVKLVDELGTLNDAIAYARKKAKLPIDAPIIEPHEDEEELFMKLIQRSFDSFFNGISKAVQTAIEKQLTSESLPQVR